MKLGGQTSPFVPGTTAYRYVRGKQLLYMDQSQAQLVDRLATDYGKIIGF